MKRKTVLWSLLGLVLIAAGAAWLVSRLEPEQVTVALPGSAEARRNPLLAAERFLRQMGEAVESLPRSGRWMDRPGPSDTLLMRANRAAFGDLRTRRLLDWVAGGGHLIMDLEGLWDSQLKRVRSELLAHFGVQVTQPGTPAVGAPNSLTKVVFGEADTRVEVEFREAPLLVDSRGQASGAVNEADGSLLLQFEHGEGRVTLVNDLGFIDNRLIGDHEHAYFLYLLAGQRGKTWLLYSPRTASLVEIIWQQANLLVITLLLLGLAWLRRGNLRIGPLIPPPPGASRDLAEHIEALGRFEQRHGLLRHRLETTQAIVERRWLHRHPQLDTMDKPARAAWIAQRLAIDPQQVEQVLYREPQLHELITETALLRRLWRGA